jgi:2-polyprenyl-6-methoxyphenol hydroxylase-like FAD-dependent oxidoreductase
MHGLIIGGGIGGLTAAIALARVGLKVTVFERAPQLREVGTGLTLWSNAMQVLRRLGVGAQTRAAASVLRTCRIVTWEFRPILDLPLEPFPIDSESPSLGIHRAELQRILSEAVGDNLRLGHACVAVRQEQSRVIARFADGHEVSGDFLLGADGLRSVVRSELFHVEKPRYAGAAVWRGVSRLDHPKIEYDATVVALGRGSQVGWLPIGGRWIYWFATANRPEGVIESRQHLKQRLLQRFCFWTSPIPELIDATPDEQILMTDLYDRPPRWPWGQGRISLLGDAAHPMTPNLGQGACQAIEDAYVLAECFRKENDPVRALRVYEHHRYARTAKLVRHSWRLGKILTLENRLACHFRDQLLRWNQRRIARQTRAVIQFDVTQGRP